MLSTTKINKSAWFLLLLSWFYSGMGHFVSGRKKLGLGLILADSICWFGAWKAIFSKDISIIYAIIFIVIWVLIWCFSLQKSFTFGTDDKQWKSVFFDAIAPGLGQISIAKNKIVGFSLLFIFLGTSISAEEFLSLYCNSIVYVVLWVWLITLLIKIIAIYISMRQSVSNYKIFLPMILLLTIATSIRWGLVFKWQWQQQLLPTVQNTNLP